MLPLQQQGTPCLAGNTDILCTHMGYFTHLAGPAGDIVAPDVHVSPLPWTLPVLPVTALPVPR